MKQNTDNFQDNFDAAIAVSAVNIKKTHIPNIKISNIDGAIFNFYKEFDIEFAPEDKNKMALTGQYYGFLGFNEYFVRFENGRKFTRVFAATLQAAKDNLTQNQRTTLFSIEKVN